jgi:hypothetical protein
VQSKFCAPGSCDAQDVTEEVMLFLQKLEGDADADELRQILAKPSTEGLLYSHDKVSMSYNLFFSDCRNKVECLSLVSLYNVWR